MADFCVPLRKKVQENFKQALRYSPHQYMVLSNYGNWLLEREDGEDRAFKRHLSAFGAGLDALQEAEFFFQSVGTFDIKLKAY